VGDQCKPCRELGLLPTPLAGEGWGGGKMKARARKPPPCPSPSTSAFTRVSTRYAGEGTLWRCSSQREVSSSVAGN
jgi:hypothetical protein